MRFHPWLLCFALLAPVAAGCAAEPAEQSREMQVTDRPRGDIGKADLYGSCLEIDIAYCGGKSSGSCWCDDQCAYYGDCCSDYADACDAGPSCDPTLICGQAISCVDGQWYPTTCGPANCDEPMGPCAPEPKHCGGFAGLSCDDGAYCHYEPGDHCGFADAMGTCQTQPEVCPQVYAPVCGCDGNNYTSPCDAHAAGVSVQYEGDCDCQPGYSKQYCWGSLQCVPLGAQC